MNEKRPMRKVLDIAISDALHNKASRDSVFGLGMVTCGLTIAFCVVLGGGWMLIQGDLAGLGRASIALTAASEARMKKSNDKIEELVRKFNDDLEAKVRKFNETVVMETNDRLVESKGIIQQEINGLHAAIAAIEERRAKRDRELTGVINQVFELEDDQRVQVVDQ